MPNENSCRGVSIFRFVFHSFARQFGCEREKSLQILFFKSRERSSYFTHIFSLIASKIVYSIDFLFGMFFVRPAIHIHIFIDIG